MISRGFGMASTLSCWNKEGFFSYSGKSSSPDLVFIIRRLYAAGAFWTSTWI
jgi:hypothetical protein